MLLAQAYEELEKGDLAQASEKAWGAAAQMLKAIAEERGWRHHSHRDLYYNIELLERETGGADIVDLFGACNYLHLNFYEDTYSVRFIERQIKQVERFVDRVEGLLK